MSEIAVANARAQVMTYDESNRKWVPSGNGEPSLSKVQIYQHKQNNTYRIVARKLNDHEVVINSALMKGMRYNKATPTFHQWRDARQVYGLNFASDSDAGTFGESVQNALDAVSDTNNGIVPSPTKPTFAQSETEIQFMAERQQQLNEERQRERDQEIRKAEEEAEKRRINLEQQDKARQLEENKKRESKELAMKLALQREKEQLESKRLEEQENEKKRKENEEFDRRQQEMDLQRQNDLRVQNELEAKARSSPRISPAKSNQEISTNNTTEFSSTTFGHLRKVSANIPNVCNLNNSYQAKVSDICEDNVNTSPAISDTEIVCNANIPSPPPDMPGKFSTGNISTNSQQSTGAPLNRRNTPQPQRSSAQSNMMSDLSAALNRRRCNGEESTSNTSTTSVTTNNNSNTATPTINNNSSNSSVTPSSIANSQSFRFEKQKSSTLDRTPKSNSLSPSPNKQLSRTDSNSITTKELQTLKQEILSEVKIELERTKQEILTAFRIELSKKH